MRQLALFLLLLPVAGCSLSSEAVVDAPEGRARAVVFDIDGTLTPQPVKIHTARPGAANAAQSFASAGYTIIYLSARTRLLQRGIPGWLEDKGFPAGRINLTESGADARDHAAFKQRVLEDYIAHGWRIEYAFGDSTTDFEAYAGAGIPRECVYALKREGRDSCEPGIWAACLEGWDDRALALSSAPCRPRTGFP